MLLDRDGNQVLRERDKAGKRSACAFNWADPESRPDDVPNANAPARDLGPVP